MCVLTCVEPCKTFDIHRNPETKHLELVVRERKCLYLYHYRMHPVFGFMNARIQTWFPFNIQVCLNGREWLARQMDAAGIGYERRDNCFTAVADYTRAQELLREQLRVSWPQMLDEVAQTLNPEHGAMFEVYPMTYYWSTYQSEWATDVVFNDPEYLRRLYPLLVRHGVCAIGSGSVLRYLGRRVRADGSVPASFRGEVVSELTERQEGVRIRHAVNGNSVKAYDKAYTAGSALLRAEATVNNASDFRVFRPKEGGPEDDLAWRKLRKGVADLHRRAEVSERATERYLDALSSVDCSTTLGEVVEKVTQPTAWHGKRVRALNPFAPDDLRLLEAVGRGEFTISGLRNRDLQRLLFSAAPRTPKERRRRSAWVGRKLRLLRAHGILQKVPKSHRYQVTKEGRRILAAVLTARNTPINRLVPESLADAA